MKTIIAIIILAVISTGIYFLIKKPSVVEVVNEKTNETTEVATTTESTTKPQTVIGKSVQDRDIIAYHYGSGDKEILFVGGIHGGYEWNTVSVAYELIDYIEANPNLLPSGLKVTVVPVLNPDGLYDVVGKAGRFTSVDVPSSISDTVSGRFNANGVDLNRNFDCDWQAKGTWQSATVSGGSKAFSEPESLAMKNYVEKNKPTAVVVWYSAAGGVYASSCHNGVSPETSTLTKTYANASGYKAYNDFNFYEITGDMVNWLAKNNIPAISVLLTNHSDTEWLKNKKGIDAVLNYYSK